MKGLLKNNFYTVYANAKIYSVLMLILGIFVAAVVKNEFVSKWGKYKLTLPVKRADIVKSYFINQIIWLLVGTLFAGTVMCLSWFLHGCPFDRSIDALTTIAQGISVSLLMGAIFFPLFYLGGAERSDVFLIITFLCAFGIDLTVVAVINKLLEPGTTAVLLGAAALLVCSLLAFSVSYPVTVGIFKHKEY